MKLLYQVAEDDKSDHIIYIDEPDSVRVVGCVDDDEYLAKLFCAAPELLEVLRLIMSGEFTMPKETELLARNIIAGVIG